MRLSPVIFGLLPYFVSLVTATALTYKLAPNEKACFFTNVEQPGAKLAFYFAVSSTFVTAIYGERLYRIMLLIARSCLAGAIRRFFRR